jgi:cytidylate kinase
MSEEEILAIPKQGPVVAIDGPAGTGKSSATKRLAEALGYVHVDTGALYRSIALQCIDQGWIPEDGPAVQDLAERATEVSRSIHLEFKRAPKKNPANRILANGKDVTDRIRTPQVSMAASQISAFPGVRASLLGLQRRLGAAGKSILEGRDIGTVIFPDADVKFFLTASVEERAKRRLSELEATGTDAPSFEELKKQIAQRDHQDSTRATAPLKRAPDAIDIDTTQLTLDQVVDLMVAKVKERLAGTKK